ncbi:alpha/beta-hydrolase [Ganoderma leucocontextum]|nr:alpha/beta-hydrolase [Ganoderma leucocontextum]
MDFVVGMKNENIMAVLEPTKLAFMKILEDWRSEIESHPQQTFKFGNTDRHKLDVFYPDPAAVSSTGPVPVLFFIYGGGFITSDRKQKPPLDLGYTNLGVFFAKRGYVPHPVLPIVSDLIPPTPLPSINTASSVIPDYPLYPTVSYPTPVEDYLLPALLPLDSPVRAATRGLIPQGSPYVFDFTTPGVLPPGIVEGYYGSQEAALATMPLALLKDAPEALIAGLPELFVLKSETEPVLIDQGNDVFVKVLEGRLGKKVRYEVMQRHNHISPHWALLTGDGEEWAEDVAAWIKAAV